MDVKIKIGTIRAALFAALLTAAGCGDNGEDAQPKPQAIRFVQDSYDVAPGKVVQSQLRITIGGSETDYDFTTNTLEVTFSTDDPAVAVVRADGMVSGVGYGSTRLVAKSASNELSAVATVRVLPSALRLDKETYTLARGASVRMQLIATENGVDSPLDNRFGIVWQSADPSVATVTDDGTITAADFGTTKLTGTSSLLGEPLTATVVVQLKKLRFEAERYELDVDETAAPRLLITENDTEADADNDGYAITWRIEDPTIASLAADGTVRGLRSGATRLIASTPYYPVEVTTVIAVRGSWTGEWMLTRWGDSDAMSGKVYMELGIDGTFALYQSLDVTGFALLRGTYQVALENGKNILKGTYSDGVSWASEYELAREGDDLFLTSLIDAVVSQYTLTEIPDYVKDGITGAPAQVVQRVAGKRFF